MIDSKARPIIIKKKIIKGAEHHGGAWKVAYADFVTAMMSLFIVLWLMNSNAKVKEAVAGYFKDPAGTGKLAGTAMEGRDKTQAPTQPPVPKQDLEKLKSQLEKALRTLRDFQNVKDHVTITLTEEGIRMELIENAKGMFFATGSTLPTKDGQEVLRATSEVIGKLPNRITIEGHTDSVPFIGTEGYTNWELSSARANAARALMTKSGIRPDQISQIRGFADQQLRVTADPSDPSNRRISIVILKLPAPLQSNKPHEIRGKG